ncbi:NUDIX domain-containing protein [Patescibacteria group bacterium]|nr:NUDIX domain-containing protein [Patescibacteria group bacterium]
MKLLLEISDKDVNNGSVERFNKPYTLRKAARAIVVNDKNEIAFQFNSKYNYHKLPGGGINEGETILQGLKREIKEETGCENIEIIDEIGMIIEYRNELDILQISYCYLAKPIGGMFEPQYDKGELEDGFKPLWVSKDEAIELLKEDKPNDYEGKFIVKRDLAFLEKVK